MGAASRNMPCAALSSFHYRVPLILLVGIEFIVMSLSETWMS